MKNLIDKTERERISSLCDYYKIKNYTINSDGTVDVDGNVVLLAKGFTELPIRFNKVSGKFTCNNNKLTTLYGCPVEVGGDFGCNKSSLTSLKFGPLKVGGYYSCPSNRLTSFEYAPTEVGGHFNAYRNNVTSLVGCPTKVGGYFDVHNNKLASLEGSPTKVGGDFNCNDNKLISLEGAPKEILGKLSFGDNKIKSLIGHTASITDFSKYSFRSNQLPHLFISAMARLSDDNLTIFIKYQNYYDVWTPGLDIQAMNDLIAEINDGLG